MARTPLTDDEIEAELANLASWSHRDGALKKTFVFRNHREAISFLVRLSYEAEQRDHHAEIHNVYATVELALRTHDAGNRVTRADVELARAIESFSWI
ncbi:MAG: 4a-hydroxytetrahydrobiopterin dehydratase [Myxococcota bacterium]|nr:4a-hydroxytetrahydrobiopterin dehydratase [Myxococcota bacterium]